VILVTAKMRCLAGAEDEFVAAALLVTAPTLAEPGCISYSCLRDIADPSAFMFVEEWADREALGAHAASEHLAVFRAAAATLLASQEVTLHTVEKSRTL
jgi:quinol monooxygenase YgiN